MRKKFTNTFFLLIILTTFNCGEDQSKEVKLAYVEGNREIRVEIENGQRYLEYDKPTKADFILTNIDMNTFSVYGLGIRMLGSENGVLKTEINVPKEHSKNDTLNIKIRFGEEIKKFEFNIPLKND